MTEQFIAYHSNNDKQFSTLDRAPPRILWWIILTTLLTTAIVGAFYFVAPPRYLTDAPEQDLQIFYGP